MKKVVLTLIGLMSFNAHSNGTTKGYIETCRNTYTSFEITVQGDRVSTKGLVTDNLDGQFMWNKHYDNPYYYDSTPNYKFMNESGDTTFSLVHDPYKNSLSIMRTNNNQGLIKSVDTIESLNCGERKWLK